LVRELENKVVFLRKLEPGGSEHSFGIHVANMAGMPNEIVLRANEILKHLEQEKSGDKTTSIQHAPPSDNQLTLFEIDPKMEKVINLLHNVDINATSPVEALLKLNEIKEILKNPKG